MNMRRPITSYAKVRALVGNLVRNRSAQLGSARVQELRLLNVGCGPNAHESFVNLDYLWHPKIDVCWNLRHGLPFASGSMLGVFSEHCLEHFPLADAQRLIREIRRVLTPGGVLRLIVPDGELYLRTYVQKADGNKSASFPYPAERFLEGLDSPILSVNRVFYQDRESPFGHCVMYDYALLEALLIKEGFAWVRKAAFKQGCIPSLLIDNESRQPESLYVEAGL